MKKNKPDKSKPKVPPARYGGTFLMINPVSESKYADGQSDFEVYVEVTSKNLV